MYKVNSQTITEDYKAESTPLSEWKFQIENGNTGELTISDPLLDTLPLAQERALSEFLKNSYKINEIRFSTHKTNIVKNMVINVYGVPYLVKSLNTSVTSTSVKTEVRGIRYE